VYKRKMYVCISKSLATLILHV